MNAILYNGQIYPQYRMGRRPTALVVTKNRIDAIGHDIKIFKSRFPKHKIINLKKRTVLPGLVDSHVHFYYWVKTLGTVHLDGVADFDLALDKVRSYAKGLNADEWVIGDGWSADRWNPYHMPTARELDQVTEGRPAAIYSKDQHIMWVNSKTLELAGIDKRFNDPPGGKVDRDPDTGEPTGILREKPVYDFVLKLFPEPKKDQLDKAWKKAAGIAYRRGVTGFHSMDGHAGWQYFNYRHQMGKLGFRILYYFPVEMLDELIKRGISSGMGEDLLRIGGVKIFTDGSLSAQTAYLKKPYENRRSWRGLEVKREDEIAGLVDKASKNNLACAIHAIGDGAVANVITAFERSTGNGSLRHRIEHLQLIDPKDIARLKKLGVIASMQPSHCPSDRELMATYWGARSKNAFVFKTLLKKNIPLCFGSDCPIEPLDPIAGIHAAVNRNGYGERGGRFYPAESLTVAEAVFGFTAGAAFAAGEEAVAGRILPGYRADLTILDDDIYKIPASQIYKARVAATVVDGKFVYTDSHFSA